MSSPFIGGLFQGLDSSGNPLSGGLLYTYAAGTLTDQATYTTSALSVANANPVVLNSSGFPTSGGVWPNPLLTYRYVLKTSAGVTVYDVDNVDNAGGSSTGFGVSVKDPRYGAVGDGVTDDTLAIQAAIDAVYLAGGGKIYFPVGRYLVSDTIWIKQRVVLEGEFAAFANQYVTNYATPFGSHLFLAAGSNCNVVMIKCDLYNDAGILKDTTLATRNSEARHGGGMRNMMVWGNRSLTAAPTAVDLNSTGHGIYMLGARYPVLENVMSMFCAEDGLRTTSIDYGTGTALGVNNAHIINYVGHNNGENGMFVSVGDSRIVSPNCGYNGATGIVTDMGNSQIIGGLSWNNLEHGVYVGGNNNTSLSSIQGLHSYDNDWTGFFVVGGGASPARSVPKLMNCTARGNGRDSLATSTAAWQKSNFVVSDSTDAWHISGCVASAYDQAGVQTSLYGFNIINTTYTGLFGADNSSFGAVTSDYYIADQTKVSIHAGVTRHPGFVATSAINMGGYALQNTSMFINAGWATYTSITSNTVAITTDNNLYTLNCTGAQTVTDLTYLGAGTPFVIIRNSSADAVTFTHNSAKLRCANGVDSVMSQYESVMFVYVSGTIWQQVGM